MHGSHHELSDPEIGEVPPASTEMRLPWLAPATRRRIGRLHLRRRRSVRVVVSGLKVVWTVALILVALVAYGLMDNRWYKVVAVEGNSMSPTFWAGDAVVMTRPPDVVREGMVLMLEVDGSLVTHRVVEVAPDGTFITQGDANDEPDDYAAADSVAIVGQVRFDVPKLGIVINRIQGHLPATSSAWWVVSVESGTITLMPFVPPDACAAPETSDEAPPVGTDCEVGG
jgi:signal peptidase I